MSAEQVPWPPALVLAEMQTIRDQLPAGFDWEHDKIEIPDWLAQACEFLTGIPTTPPSEDSS